jgi:hypothetical protein
MDEEIKTQRKQWHQPGLIVLVRGTPEEAVLQFCKAGPATGGKSGSNNNEGPGCGYNTHGTCTASCLNNLRS